MSQYFVEILRGSDHVYLGYAENDKPRVRPQERNAARFETTLIGNAVVKSLLDLSPANMRELVKVSADYVQPLRISLRRIYPDMSTAMVTQKMYRFKEVAT